MIDLLELPDVRSQASSNANGRRYIDAQLAGKAATCTCGFEFTEASKAWKTTETVDAPIRREPVVVRLKRPGRCPQCRATQPKPDFVHPMRNMTIRCHDYISSYALSLPASKIADMVGVSASTVERIVNNQREALASRFKPYLPEFLGIDEVRVRGQFRNIMVDLQRRVIVDVLPAHDNATLQTWLNQFSGYFLDVKEVTMDQTNRYREIFKARCPGATIIYDKFHFVRLLNLAVYKAYLQTNWASTSRTTAAARARRLLWAKAAKLDKHGEAELLGFLSNGPDLALCHQAKEKFLSILEIPELSAAQAKREVRDWRNALPAEIYGLMAKVISAVDDWRPQVVAMLVCKNTNSITEGLNRVVKLASMATPSANFQQLRLRLILGQRRWSQADQCSCCAELVLPGQELVNQFGLELCSRCAESLRQAEGA